VTTTVQQFGDAYDAVLGQWPVTPEPITVTTSQGRTQVYAAGPVDAPALVLLHGGGATSAVWFANVGELSHAHRVYAVDIIVDAGRSEPAERIRTKEGLVDWLSAVLDGLGVTSAAIAGHSYGAWLALTYALHAPGRVRRLALLDPTSCFAGLSPAYLLHAVPVMLRPSPARMRAFLRWETSGAPLDERWLDLVSLATVMPHAIVMPQRPQDFSGFDVPTLILLAGNSRAHDAAKLGATARRMIPGTEIALLPDATHHTVPTQHADAINKALLTFL
jgi:pimeloyl-ACP methyl ester carboxylesterase